jgi:hypothetical protein
LPCFFGVTPRKGNARRLTGYRFVFSWFETVPTNAIFNKTGGIQGFGGRKSVKIAQFRCGGRRQDGAMTGIISYIGHMLAQEAIADSTNLT